MSKVKFNLQSVTGIVIILHGLLRIIFYRNYVDFVIANFIEFIPSETTLVIGAAIFPFLEFFTGMLIYFNIETKKAIIAGILISLIMIAFILIGSLYPRIIYHAFIMALLIFLFVKSKNEDYFKSAI